MSLNLCRCGKLVSGKCEACTPARQQQGTTTERGYDNKWRVLSERKRRLDPLCERCAKNGYTKEASEVHHIVPIQANPSLRLVWSNLMSVCSACHAEVERELRNAT